MKRRHFVGSAIAGLTTTAVPGSSKKLRAGDIPKRIFGKTGEKLTVIGQAGGRFPLNTFEEAKAITRRAYDLGINYFDNAHSYWRGRSEEVFGAVLPEVRNSVFITTKSTNRTRKGAEAELDLSLKRMNTDYVDLWQIHSVGHGEDLEKIFSPGGAMEAFEAAKKAGKCRFIGFTGHYDPAAHLKMLELYDAYDTIMIPLNPADPSYLSFEKQVLPRAVELGLGIQGMKSTANAKLLQAFNAKKCIHYVLSLPIHCLAVGCTTLGQIEDDVRFAEEFKPLGASEMALMRDKAQKLSGPQLENWKRDVLTASSSRRTSEYLGA